MTRPPTSFGPSMSGSRRSLAMSGSRRSQAMSGNSQADVGHSSASARASMTTDRRSSSCQPRQSTAGPSRRQSFFQSSLQPAGVPRDPRPLKDRSFQARIGKELVEYMACNGFEAQTGHVLSPDAMKSPTQKDFNYMFQWLFHRIDPNYKFIKNIEHEVPPILKWLKYPYERSITKSQLAAVGGPNWSTFLGLLHWLMLVAKMLDGYMSKRSTDDMSRFQIMYDYLRDAYKDWTSSDMGDKSDDEVLAPHIETMARRSEQLRSKRMEELRDLEEEKARLLEEMEDVKNLKNDESTIDKDNEEIEKILADHERYHNEARLCIDKYQNRIKKREQELVHLDQEIKEEEEKHKKLESEVAAHGISMEEVHRMIDERERVKEELKSATTRLGDAKKNVDEEKLKIRSMLGELKQTVKTYNSLAYRIGIVPATACNAKGGDYELKLVVNDGSDFTSPNLQSSGSGALKSTEELQTNGMAGNQPGHIVNLDLRGHVLPYLRELQNEISERCNAAEERTMKDDERLEAIKKATVYQADELEALDEKIREAEYKHGLLAEANKTRRQETKAELDKMAQTVTRLELKLNNLKNDEQHLEDEEMAKTAEFEQLQIEQQERQGLSAKMRRTLDIVVDTKIEIQHDLEQFEKLVNDELAALEQAEQGDCEQGPRRE
ncbi:hypothetical protein CDD82_4263 [Ophiocordyceps australis]|uniref:Kinetochore protein NDC80 n=1 Tax=Ophiocordyceps australis TaxID=1399860 RepID=A0A2C5ZSY2_9HYPO|nr:hypothetical protein CDD82_4263 [Ophiocordyceps australis]